VVTRRALAATILGGWLLILGWHVRREYFASPTARLLERAQSLAPGTFFYSIRMNDRAIGLATTQLDTVDTGFRFSDRVILDVPALGQTHRAITQTEIHMDSVLQLRSFNFLLGSEIGEYAVRGQVRDRQLDLELRTGNDAQKSTIGFDPGVLLDAALSIRLAAGGQLKVGQSVVTRIFNPSVLAEQPIELRVSARDTLIVPDSARHDGSGWTVSSYDTIPVWRIDQTAGSLTVSSWVDEDGHLVKAESPLGYTLERTAFELADQDWKRTLAAGVLESGYGAIIERTAIAANVKVTEVGRIDSLRVRLAGVELDGFDLSGGRQLLQGDTLIVQREQGAHLAAGYTLPYRGTGEALAELGSTPFIQSESPDIRRTARQITNGSRDPTAVAQRLTMSLYRRLEKDITLSIPSAEQVLRARKGDCNEHTVLFVALARALGLPARTAAGLVHLNGRFYYHAWPEVWLADRWVAVDPTLGQFPADASHLRFITGGLARQVELIRLIGRLHIEVL
jgi:hypothetical protein